MQKGESEPQNGSGFNPSHLKEMGLFRHGIHTDEVITATGPNGDRVELNVTPVHVDNDTGTIFVAKEGQSEALKLLFPRKRWNI